MLPGTYTTSEYLYYLNYSLILILDEESSSCYMFSPWAQSFAGGHNISLILSAAIWEADFYSWTRGLHLLLLRITVQGNAVLLSQGSQLLQELSVQDNGKDSALGLRGNSRTGGQDTERRQRQSVLHRAIGKRWIQDDVTALRLEALCGTHTSIINWRLKNVLFVTFQKWLFTLSEVAWQHLQTMYFKLS